MFAIRKSGFFALMVTGMLIALPAFGAITNLKQVQISNGSQVDLLFDGKIQKSQIRTEFFNDIIQLSLIDVSVYPAKISSVNGGSLTKIFAYQYAPKLVRCRFTVKGKAEDYKDRFDVKPSGKILTIRVNGEAVAQAPVEKTEAVRDPEEQALMNRVLAAEAAPVKAAPVKDSITTSAAASTAVAVASTASLPVKVSHEKIAGAKPLPSPLKAFGKMAIVLGLFGIVALVLKRIARSRNEPNALAQAGLGDSPSVFGALGRIAKGLRREPKMIEVISTHYLGPKKSIAMVRVAGRVLVLGVTNDAINLITQLSGEDEDLDLAGLGITSGTGAVAAGKPVFAHMLATEASKPAAVKSGAPLQKSLHAYGETQTQRYASQDPVLPGASNNSLSSVRAQIRSRLEGLKQL